MGKMTSSSVLFFMFMSLVGGICCTPQATTVKKHHSLEYEFDKSVYYLLICSGVVEIINGPTLRKLKSIPASQKLRTWVWDMCSISLKILKGIPVNSKPKALWKVKPDNWPCDQPFYDPRNKTKGGHKDIKSDVNLLKRILGLCNQQKLDISQYQREITAWENGDKKLLFELHTCRMEIQKINTYTQGLINYRDTTELQKMLGQKKIQIDFSGQNFKNEKQKGTTDIIREVAVLLCKIIKQIPPMEKRDGIWKTPPIGWKDEHPFYSPHNAGESSEKDKDKKLVNNLVEYIEKHKINIPLEYATLFAACKQKNMSELCKIYTIHKNVAVIVNVLQFLQMEGLLGKPDVLDKLKQHGLTLSTEWFDGCSTSTGICDSNQASTSHQSTYVNLDGCSTSTGICDSNQASTSHQSTYVDLSNAQQKANGRKCGSFDNATHAPSCRKRSNQNCSTQEAKGKCLIKKRKTLHDENTEMKKGPQKHSSENATLHDIQPSVQHILIAPNSSISLHEFNQYLDPTEEQPVAIVNQNNWTTDVLPEEQPDNIVAEDNQTTFVQTGEHHDATEPCGKVCGKITACRLSDTHTDLELSENPKNDKELNEILDWVVTMMDSSNTSERQRSTSWCTHKSSLKTTDEEIIEIKKKLYGETLCPKL